MPGISHFLRHRKLHCLRRFSSKNINFISTARKSPLNTTVLLIRTLTSLLSSSVLISCTQATRGGMDIIHLLITQPAEASMEPFVRPKQMLRESLLIHSSFLDTAQSAASVT